MFTSSEKLTKIKKIFLDNPLFDFFQPGEVLIKRYALFLAEIIDEEKYPLNDDFLKTKMII